MKQVKVVPKKIRYLIYKYLIKIYQSSENSFTRNPCTSTKGLCGNLITYLINIGYFSNCDGWDYYYTKVILLFPELDLVKPSNYGYSKFNNVSSKTEYNGADNTILYWFKNNQERIKALQFILATQFANYIKKDKEYAKK